MREEGSTTPLLPPFFVPHPVGACLIFSLPQPDGADRFRLASLGS